MNLSIFIARRYFISRRNTWLIISFLRFAISLVSFSSQKIKSNFDNLKVSFQKSPFIRLLIFLLSLFTVNKKIIGRSFSKFTATLFENFITVISSISMMGVAVGTMALIIVLSVFNGLEALLQSLYNSFDPEIKIEVIKGKTFDSDISLIEKINSINGVKTVVEVVEDYAYIKYRDSEIAVQLKGVGDNFVEDSQFETAVVEGKFQLKEGDVNYAIIGKGIQYALSINPTNQMEPLQVHYVKNLRPGITDPSQVFNKRLILPGGIFMLEKTLDESYIIVPLQFALELFDYTTERTSLEVILKEGANEESIQDQIKNIFGNNFRVLNGEEQHASILRTIKIEKFFVFLIFTFILAVASFNIFFSLTMLTIDKKKDISVLYSMGANDNLIRGIFLSEGALIAFSGAFVGLVVGFIIGWSQQEFGLISMGMETSILNYYPIKMELADFIYIGLSIVVITLLASVRPAFLATKFNNNKNL